MKLTVEYDPEAGHAIRDSQIEGWVDGIIETCRETEDRDDWTVVVGNELTVHFFRIQVTRGVLSTKELEFKFGDMVIPVDKNGCLNTWPDGFCDYNDHLLEELIGWTEPVKKVTTIVPCKTCHEHPCTCQENRMHKPIVVEKTISFGKNRYRVDSKGNWTTLMFGWWPTGTNPSWRWSPISKDRVPIEVRQATV